LVWFGLYICPNQTCIWRLSKGKKVMTDEKIEDTLGAEL
jgi:hypothetical protein